MRPSLLWTGLFSLTLVGCGNADRDEDVSPGGGGPGGGPDDGGGSDVDTGDDGDGGDDGGIPNDVGDGGEPGDDGNTDEPSGDTGGDDGDTGDGGGDDPPGENPPDCNPYWSLWVSPSSAEPPVTRDEFWCYVNRKRQNSSSHDRSNGPFDDEGDGSVTWPYMMDYDKDLMDSAQAEAERVAAGGSPVGRSVGASFGAKNVWITGNNTADYMLTTEDDYLVDWWDPTPCCHDPDKPSGISTSNGGARMGLYYHDYSGAGPVLTHMGTGMVEDGNGARVWVVRLAP